MKSRTVLAPSCIVLWVLCLRHAGAMLWVFWNFSTRGNNKELPGSWGLTSVEGTLPQRKIIKRKSWLSEKLQYIWWNSVWNRKVWVLDNLRKRAFTSSVWKEKLFKLWKRYWFYCCNIYDPLFIGHATISLVILISYQKFFPLACSLLVLSTCTTETENSKSKRSGIIYSRLAKCTTHLQEDQLLWFSMAIRNILLHWKEENGSA